MRKKRKVLLGAATAVLLGCTCFFAACSLGGGSGNSGDTGNNGEPAHKHSYEKTLIEATCKTGGYTLYVCTCGDSYQDNWIGPVEHDYLDGFCRWCGRPDPWDPSDPGGSEPNHPVDPTDPENPDNPVDPENPDIPDNPDIPHEHSYTVKEEHLPSCTETGYILYQCDCGETYTEYTIMLDHNYHQVDEASVEPTCTQNGYWTYVCEFCGDEDRVIRNSNGHRFGSYNYVPTTCTEYGYRWAVCEVCGYKDIQSDADTPGAMLQQHMYDFDAYVPDGNATCKTGGTESTYCLYGCGAHISRSSDALGHEYENGVCIRCEEPEPTDGLRYYGGTPTTCIVSIGTATDSNIVISSFYNGKLVTEIAADGFKNCSNIHSVYIPDSITKIGNNAFEGCIGLEEIDIPDSVTEIGEEAFKNCCGLSEIDIPDSVKIIKSCAFEGCSNLETLIIPEGVLSVGVSFIAGSGIKTLSLPDSITSIMGGELKGSSCLENLTIPYIGFSILNPGLSSTYYGFGYIFGTQSYDGSVATVQGYETYYIPETLTHLTVTGGTILSGAFSNSKLTSVTIGKNVTELSNSAFTGCTLLQTVRWNAVNCARSETDLKSPLANITSQFNLYIGEEVAALPDQAFASCGNLNNVVIENGLTTIGKRAFFDCARLFSVQIPASVTEIGEEAFYNCPILTNLYWSSGLTSVGKNAFGGDCSRISNIYYTGGIASWCGIQFNGNRANPLYVNPILYIDNVRVTELEIPYGVTSIGDYAFYGYSVLARIYIPDSVRNIGICAFENTTYYNDESNWEDGALYIGNHLIRVKTDVTGTINVKQDALTIADGAFYNCDKVTSVVIPNGITRIGNHVFYYCRALTDLEIPDSVTSIGNYAFYYCTLLNIDNLTSVTEIGEYAFYFCFSLASIEILNSITSIGDYAFYGCSGMRNIELPDSLTSIGNYAFSNCSNLSSIELPNSVTSIGDYAFSECRSLTSIEIPNSVTSIGNYAFYGCSGLTGILVIPDNVTSIGESAFRSCTGLTSVVIGSGVTEIGNLAFYQCSGLTLVTWNASACTKAGVPSATNPNAYYLIFLDCTNVWGVVIGKNVTSIPANVFFGCSNLRAVYYEGSQNEWEEISIGSSALLKPTRYYYSEEQPAYQGTYWHYDTDGVTPVKW